jgi:hypothetical protein
MIDIVYYVSLAAGVGTALTGLAGACRLLWWLHCRLKIIDDMIDGYRNEKGNEKGI